MDLEFFVHGVPNGQKVWGKKTILRIFKVCIIILIV